MTEKEYDLIVIGAGVIGYSIAFRLQQQVPAMKVAILGDPVNSLMASRAAAGMLAPFAECEQADRFFLFCRESLEKYPRFIEDLVAVSGVPVYFSMAGSLIPSSFFQDSWEERKRFFREQNVPHEVWPPAKVREKTPQLAKSCGEVIWAGEGQVNNRQMHDSLAAASRKLGADVLINNVTGFIRDGSRISAVVTDSGEYRGKRFLLASGSWSSQLGKVLDVSIPLKPIKGQMCRLQVEDGALDYTIHGRQTYIAPCSEGQGFVLGSTMEDRGFNPAIEEEVIQTLIDNAAAVLPFLRNAPLIESWTGLRPAAKDLMPVMGKSVRYDNLYYSTGHYRNGILMTPNQADYMAGLILGALKEEVEEFKPSRFDL
jgi:glycine oxidase